jgi:hypothetical protein
MFAAGCTGLDALNPICQAGSIGGSVASAGFESVLSGISQWVASGAEWLLDQIGDVLSATTTVNLGAIWFQTHYGQMTALAGVVILPMLLASTLQAIVRQNPGQLIRTFLLQLPLALLLAVVAVQIVILSLSATDAMSEAVAGGTSSDVSSLLDGVTSGLVNAAADPSIASFVLLLVALLIAVAAFVLWLELLIRAAAVYVAVLFLPLALATLVWPAISHWCRRLIETLGALILSKFVIVATLSLAAGAVSSGTSGGGDHGSGFSSVLAGGALLLMATFVPFAILRMIPAVEAGAVAHLDGLRERGMAGMTRAPRTAANHALHEGLGAVGDARLLAQTAAGGGAAGLAAGAGGSGGAGGGGGGSAGETSGGEDGDPGTGIPRKEGALTAQDIEDRFAPGALGQSKGESPMLAAPVFGPGSLDYAGPESTAEAAAAAEPAPTGFEPDPADRVGARSAKGRRIGPATPDEAWMWQGVPPGRALMTHYRPGQPRAYMEYEAGGSPSVRTLPPAWPAGEEPDT